MKGRPEPAQLAAATGGPAGRRQRARRGAHPGSGRAQDVADDHPQRGQEPPGAPHVRGRRPAGREARARRPGSAEARQAPPRRLAPPHGRRARRAARRRQRSFLWTPLRFRHAAASPPPPGRCCRRSRAAFIVGAPQVSVALASRYPVEAPRCRQRLYVEQRTSGERPKGGAESRVATATRAARSPPRPAVVVDRSRASLC